MRDLAKLRVVEAILVSCWRDGWSPGLKAHVIEYLCYDLRVFDYSDHARPVLLLN